MVTLILGVNGSGKTLYLQNKYEELWNKHKDSVITNLKDIPYSSIDDKRYSLLCSDDAHEDIWDWHEIKIERDAIYVEDKKKIFSNNFLELITLLCRPGEYLILDEPEFGLSAREVITFREICKLLLPTYNEVYISTHQQWLFSLGDKWLWIQGYNAKYIEWSEVRAHIGSLRR